MWELGRKGGGGFLFEAMRQLGEALDLRRSSKPTKQTSCNHNTIRGFGHVMGEWGESMGFHTLYIAYTEGYTVKYNRYIIK